MNNEPLKYKPTTNDSSVVYLCYSVVVTDPLSLTVTFSESILDIFGCSCLFSVFKPQQHWDKFLSLSSVHLWTFVS